MRREPRRGRERHAAQARAAAAVHHVDGRDLADGLQEDAVELRLELRHELGALGRGRDRVAEDVPAAREEGADRGRVVPLQDERLGLRQGDDLRRDGRRLRARGGALAEELRGVLQLEVLALLRLGAEAVRLGAGVDAQPAGVAVVEVQDDGHEPRERVDLVAGLDAVLRAGFDAAAAALAELVEQHRFGSFANGGRTGHGGPSGTKFDGLRKFFAREQMNQGLKSFSRKNLRRLRQSSRRPPKSRARPGASRRAHVPRGRARARPRGRPSRP